MLNDDDCIARINELIQHLDQTVDVGHMQAGGRLVEDIDGLPGIAAGQLIGQLDALRFTARKRRGCLTQLDVAKADLLQRLQLACDLRNVGEKYAGLLHRHVQHVGDGLVLVLDLERFTVVALALADVTGHVNIRQKVHFNRQDAAAFAGFAASALDIEAEPPGAVAAHFGILCVGKQRADVAKHACVGGRVGARRAANRRLVDADDLIDPLHALDLLTLAGAAACTVQGGSQRFVQNFVDKRRLAGAGHAGNADQLAEREVYGNVSQIVLMGLDDAQHLAVSLAACLGNLYEFAA